MGQNTFEKKIRGCCNTVPQLDQARVIRQQAAAPATAINLDQQGEFSPKALGLVG